MFRRGYGTARACLMLQAPALACLPGHGGGRGWPDGGHRRDRGRRDGADRAVVTGDAIARPQPGRGPATAASHYPMSGSSETLPSRVRPSGNTISRPRHSLPISRRLIRGILKQSEAISRTRVTGLAQFPLGISGRCPAAGGTLAARVGHAAARQHHRWPTRVRI